MSLPSLRQSLSGIVVLALAISASGAQAGAFVFSNVGQEGRIAHPKGYIGQGGEVVVGVCLAPTQLPASLTLNDVQGSLNKALSTWNALIPTRENLGFGSNNDVPTGRYDLESAFLHELGHCIGLAHVNHSTESLLASAQQNGTKSTAGTDTVFNQEAGPDALHGSPDDVRGDDQSLYWFEQNWADPDRLPAIIDFTTYTRQLSGLPAGHTFPSNADRNYLASRGIPNTEYSLQQGQQLDETQRQLTAEDIATLRLGQSGSDGVQGTADDYTIRLVPSTTDCDIQVQFDAETSFAFCSVSGNSIAPNHYQITTANMRISPNVTWYASPAPNTQVVLSSAQGNAWPAFQPFPVRATISKLLDPPTGNPAGTVTITGSDGHRCTTTLDATAQATCTWPAQASPGSLTLSGTYHGYRGFDRSNGSLVHTVNPSIAHSFTLTTQPSSMVVGEPVNIEVRSSSSQATGVVTLTHPHGLGCVATLTAGEDSCSARVPSQAGSSSWTLSYPGDNQHPPRSTTFPSSVARAPSVMTLTHPTPIRPTVAFQVTAQVTAGSSGAVVPTGNVRLTLGASACTAAVGGSCTLAAPNSAGSFTLEGQYDGDASSLPVIKSQPFAVTRAVPTLTLSAPTTAVPASIITATAQLSSPGPLTARVTMTLADQSCLTPVGGGSCTLPAPVVEGIHSLTASYPGDIQNASASAQRSLTTARVASSLSAQAPARVVPGGQVLVQASASAAGATTTGAIEATLGSASCTIQQGSCTLFAPPSEGPVNLVVRYLGDVQSQPSAIERVVLVVRRVTELTLVAPHQVSSSSFTLTATGSAEGRPVAPLVVTLVAEPTDCHPTPAQPSCELTLGETGTHRVRVIYEGDVENAPASAEATVDFVSQVHIFAGGFED